MTDSTSLTPTAAATDLKGPDEAHFVKSVTLYRELAFPPERIVVQLANAGHPKARIRAQFPDIPDSAYPEPRRTREAQRRALQNLANDNEALMPSRRAAVHSGDSIHPGQGSERLLPTASELLTGMRKVPAGATRESSSFSRTHEEHPNPKALRAELPSAASALSRSEVSPCVVSVPETSAEISFQYVPLIQCSFPHADPGETTTFSRRNGWLELTLSTARADTGLPYGVPARLLTIYCASEAIRTRSPEIYLGASVHDFLRQLDVPITRGERGSLRVYANQLLRLIHCAISIDENITDAKGRTGLHIRQALFAEEARLWWDEASGVGRGSSLVLSSVLFQSILERSAPLSTRAIKLLRKSPMDLDVYAWLAHRLFNLNRPSTITWDQLSGQFGHSYAEPRKFRRFFLGSLKRVQEVYPDAKLKVADVGLILLPSRPHVSRTALPGKA